MGNVRSQLPQLSWQAVTWEHTLHGGQIRANQKHLLWQQDDHSAEIQVPAQKALDIPSKTNKQKNQHHLWDVE